MKAKLLFLTLIFSFFMLESISQTVYVTKTGAKYHADGCRYLSKSKISISLSDAKAKGYGACSVCKPDSKVKTQSATVPVKNENQGKATDGEKTTQQKAVPQKTTKSVQCSARTKAGNRCKRMTTSTNGKCWQHGGN